MTIINPIIKPIIKPMLYYFYTFRKPEPISDLMAIPDAIPDG